MDPRKQILSLVGSAKPVPLAAIPAGWPEGLYLRKPSLVERDGIARYVQSVPDGQPTDLRAYILVRLVCDESGQRLFADDDCQAFANVPADPAYTALTNQAMQLCGFVDEGDEGNS